MTLILISRFPPQQKEMLHYNQMQDFVVVRKQNFKLVS